MLKSATARYSSLQQEIAQLEQQADSIEADTLAMIASLPLGGSHKPATLGKALSSSTRTCRSTGMRLAPFAICRRPAFREPSKT
jgi:hypothetical protein